MGVGGVAQLVKPFTTKSDDMSSNPGLTGYKETDSQKLSSDLYMAQQQGHTDNCWVCLQ